MHDFLPTLYEEWAAYALPVLPTTTALPANSPQPGSDTTIRRSNLTARMLSTFIELCSYDAAVQLLFAGRALCCLWTQTTYLPALPFSCQSNPTRCRAT